MLLRRKQSQLVTKSAIRRPTDETDARERGQGLALVGSVGLVAGGLGVAVTGLLVCRLVAVGLWLIARLVAVVALVGFRRICSQKKTLQSPSYRVRILFWRTYFIRYQIDSCTEHLQSYEGA